MLRDLHKQHLHLFGSNKKTPLERGVLLLSKQSIKTKIFKLLAHTSFVTEDYLLINSMAKQVREVLRKLFSINKKRVRCSVSILVLQFLRGKNT